MSHSSDDDSKTVQVSGWGCAAFVIPVCLLLLLVNDRFWAGLRMVIEATR